MERIVNKKLIEELKEDAICTACGIACSQIHHVRTVGAGGSDLKENLMPLCFRHHRQVHDKGLFRFAIDFLTVRMWLLSNGWEVAPDKNKWIRVRE